MPAIYHNGVRYGGGSKGEQGVSVTSAEIQQPDNVLIITLSDGQKINAGKIVLSSGGSVSLDNYYTKKETDDLISEASANTFLTEEEIKIIFAD